MSRASGREALVAFLQRRAKDADQVVALEEAMLAGRFASYAARRLTAFGLSRAVGVFLHIVELTWLYDVFGPRSFVASLALQNVSIVIEALWWGALEAHRRRARELGPDAIAATLTMRWLTVATWLAIPVVLAPLAIAGWAWHRDGSIPTTLHAYAFVCALRLGADLVLRTYYSGVFAFGRVHRPVWSVLVGPLLLVGGSLLLFDALGGWSFVASLLASVVATRALLFVFTRRAYRRRRLPPPRLRLRLRVRSVRSALPGRATIKAAGLAAFANVSTRIGAVVVLAAVIPSLGIVEGPDDEPMVEPFAFALHAAAPLLLVASQWGLVFYHDWKRVEDDEAHTLARHLHRRLLVTAVVLALVAWAMAVAIIVVFVPLEEVRVTLGALLVAMIGLSVWTALQLRTFARGEHIAQATSAVGMLLVAWAALAAPIVDRTSWYLALAAAPWSAVALHVLLARLRASPATGEVATVAHWTRTLRAARGHVTVWNAEVAGPATRVASSIARALGSRGALVRTGKRLLWFEQDEASSRAEWVRAASGALAMLESFTSTGAADAHLRLVERGMLGRAPPGRLDDLRAEHARLFPEGFVVAIGQAPPPSFRALSPATRQALWRDAIRAGRGAKRHSRWYVTIFAPDGAAEAIFAAPKPVEPARAAAWRATLDRGAR